MLARYTSNHELVRSKVRILADILFNLPSETHPLHSAMDPLFCVVVCCCLTSDGFIAERLLSRSIGLGQRMKSVSLSPI